jgi:hypothetical protein
VLSVAHPYLGFCPYLPLSAAVTFADWEIGPVKAFDGRWSDARFESQAKAFLAKFVDGSGSSIKNPSILCRQGRPIDGTLPSAHEIDALEHAIPFSFLDQNPRHGPDTEGRSWAVVTADNTDVFYWPIDVDAGYVAVRTGKMVQTLGGGYRIADRELAIRPPLDLHLPLGAQSADSAVLESIYRTVLSSASQPGANATADRLRVAISWFIKAWRNTATVNWSERIVFLKTAFEAITATEKSHISAQLLRDMFRAIPDTSPTDSELLIWSPAEAPNRPRQWTDRGGNVHVDNLTDLEHWFMEFAGARNSIIHNGITPSLVYNQPGSAYNGHMVFTAEFLFRAVIKVSLTNLGHKDLWRSRLWRTVKAAYEKLAAETEANGTQSTSPSA